MKITLKINIFCKNAVSFYYYNYQVFIFKQANLDALYNTTLKFTLFEIFLEILYGVNYTTKEKSYRKQINIDSLL